MRTSNERSPRTGGRLAVSAGVLCLLLGVGMHAAAAAEEEPLTDVEAPAEEATTSEPAVDQQTTLPDSQATSAETGTVRAAALAMTVTPNVGLEDTDTVTVTWSGATQNVNSVFECATANPPGGIEATFTCDVSNIANQLATPGPDGTATLELDVHFGAMGAEGNCAKTCHVVVVDNYAGKSISAPITLGQPVSTNTTTTTSTTVVQQGATTTTAPAAVAGTERARSAGGSTGGRELADTGVGSGILAAAGTGLLGLGASLLGAGRRKRR